MDKGFQYPPPPEGLRYVVDEKFKIVVCWYGKTVLTVIRFDELSQYQLEVTR